MIYICCIFLTLVIGVCIVLGVLMENEVIGKILITLGVSAISFFVLNGLHYMNGDHIDNSKSPCKVTIEKEDVTEVYQVTSYSIDGNTVKLVLESGNVEYYVLKKGEKVKCQY